MAGPSVRGPFCLEPEDGRIIKVGGSLDKRLLPWSSYRRAVVSLPLRARLLANWPLLAGLGHCTVYGLGGVTEAQFKSVCGVRCACAMSVHLNRDAVRDVPH